MLCHDLHYHVVEFFQCFYRSRSVLSVVPFVHEGRLRHSQDCNEERVEPKISSKLLGSFNFYPSDDVVPVLGLGQRVAC